MGETVKTDFQQETATSPEETKPQETTAFQPDPKQKRCISALENAMAEYGKDRSSDNFGKVMDALFLFVKYGGQLLLPVQDMEDPDQTGKNKTGVRVLSLSENELGAAVFTSVEEAEKGERSELISSYSEIFFDNVKDSEEISAVILNPWNNPFVLEKELINELLDALRESHARIVRGKIAEAGTDCVVNVVPAAEADGSAASGTIHAAAGSELLEAYKAAGTCGVGEAILTPAFQLKHPRYVIHTVVPKYEGTEDKENRLAACYWTILDLAKSNRIHTIAIPPLGIGEAGFPTETAANIGLIAIDRWMTQNNDYGIDVFFCCRGSETERIVRAQAELLGAPQSDAEDAN